MKTKTDAQEKNERKKYIEQECFPIDLYFSQIFIEDVIFFSCNLGFM